MERATGLAAEALLGRRDMGGGSPVRLRSKPSRLPSGGPGGLLVAWEPFMVDERAWAGEEKCNGAPAEPVRARGRWPGLGGPGHHAPWEGGGPLLP